MTRLPLICSVIALLCSAQTQAEISNGFEAQVRLQAGETFVNFFDNQGSAPYIPSNPYGYVGYKLPSGLSLGLGLGFTWYKLDDNVATHLLHNNGWALMVAPTIQYPFVRGEHYEMFGAARFVLGAGRTYLQGLPTTPGTPSTQFTATPQMSYGGNLGLGGTWYPIGCFGLGAEVGGAVNYLDADSTTTIATTVLPTVKVNAWYVQTYFALTSNFVF